MGPSVVCLVLMFILVLLTVLLANVVLFLVHLHLIWFAPRVVTPRNFKLVDSLVFLHVLMDNRMLPIYVLVPLMTVPLVLLKQFAPHVVTLGNW